MVAFSHARQSCCFISEFKFTGLVLTELSPGRRGFPSPVISEAVTTSKNVYTRRRRLCWFPPTPWPPLFRLFGLILCFFLKIKSIDVTWVYKIIVQHLVSFHYRISDPRYPLGPHPTFFCGDHHSAACIISFFLFSYYFICYVLL